MKTRTVESVPLFDLTRQNKACEGELRAAFERVMQSGMFIMGPEVEAFEKESASLLGAKHAIGVSSGTDALLLAFMALGLGPGDEVLVPDYTFFATAGCVSRTGAKPVFVDVLPCCLNMDPRALERAIGPRWLGGPHRQGRARSTGWLPGTQAPSNCFARFKGT